MIKITFFISFVDGSTMNIVTYEKEGESISMYHGDVFYIRVHNANYVHISTFNFSTHNFKYIQKTIEEL
jgi:ubiquinone/menaquinone biosynthesis C-methylase UbiE